jgi:hypothetical protein
MHGLFLALFLTAAIAAARTTNPFFTPNTLPYQAPPFDKIKDADFQPALEEGMKREVAEMEKIADHSETPTFANTIEAMERSGDLLRRVQRVFSGLTQSTRAITRHISRTSGAAAIRPVTTRIYGAKCSTTTRITGSRSAAA